MQYWDLPECSICHERLSHTLCTLSQCGHVYHDQCIKQWISKNKTGIHKNCPLCRKNVSKTEIVSLKYETISKKIGDSTDEQINFLEGEIKFLRSKLTNVNLQNTSLNVVKESLIDENTKLSSKLIELDHKKTELLDKIKEYELQINSLGAINKRLSESLEEYKSKIEKNEAFTNYIKSVTESEGDILTNLSKDEKINVLLQRVVFLSRSNKELSQIRDKWKKSYRELNTLYSELQSEYQSLVNDTSYTKQDLVNFTKVQSNDKEYTSPKKLFNDQIKIADPQDIKPTKLRTSSPFEKRKILQQLNFKPIKRQQGIKNFFDPIN